MNNKYLLVLVVCFTLLNSCSTTSNNWSEKTEKATYIHRSIKKITDVMVHDIYSPLVASRTYLYISTAGYEVAINGDKKKDYLSLANQLRGLNNLPKPDKNKKYSFTLAAVDAILTVGQKMVTSEKIVSDFHNQITNEFIDDGMPEEVFKNSIEFGQEMAKAILDWSAEDNYIKTRSMAQYDVRSVAAAWKPTPPAYMKAVEPNWDKMRTLLIDSASQFKPVAPPAFSTDSTSEFYQSALIVYNALKEDKQNKVDIAKFWDCNPFQMNTKGHMMYASKKISPGGHWMNIAGVAAKTKNADYIRTTEAYISVAINLYDGFISCWDEKYRSQTIRPETYINEYIDKRWKPLLQTPPFPEYPSGHSVASNSAAVVLTRLFGDNFSFCDSTEVEFGLPKRDFKSFTDAANEAAISRLYGGIHYMQAIQNGALQGKKLGEFCVANFDTRKSKKYNN